MQFTWDAVLLGVALALAFVIPLKVASDPSQQALSLVWEGAVTLLFSLDVLIRWRRKRGPALGWTAVDVLAALPLGPALGLPAMGLLRLLNVMRVVPKIAALQRRVSVHPAILRMCIFIFGLTISAHWLACVWVWLDGPGLAEDAAGPYLGALYWCITTLTAVGYGDVTPVTRPQVIYSMFVMLLGVGLYGFVIGNLATLITRLDMAKAEHAAQLEQLTGFMRYRRVPLRLQQQIHDYFRYLWENRKGYDEATVLGGLPPTLRRELSLVLKGDLIDKVSFLKGASREFVHDLSTRLQAVVFMPGDVIVRHGDYGRHVYFISSGEVEVLKQDGTPIRNLTEGDFFGELALLRNETRTTTVRAVGYCDVYTLDRSDFTQILADYPDFAEHIEEVVEERRKALDGGADSDD
jgi:voltage-gated potassium channel